MTASDRRTILVLAYNLSPIRGSEYSVGWNYVSRMALSHDLIVLYGSAGEHMGDFEEMAHVTVPNVRFVPVAPPPLARLANAANRRGMLVYSFYIAYRLWHRKAYRVARQICAAQRIDIVHYLSPIGFREPGYLWKLDRPYVWGPVGGMPPYPAGLFHQLNRVAGFKAWLRNIANHLQLHTGRRLSRAMARADMLLAATSANAEIIRRVFGREAAVMPENAILDIDQGDRPAARSEELQIIWAGSLVPRKAAEILLRALGGIDPRRWRLTLVGEGPLLARMRELAGQLNIAGSVTFAGKVPRDRVLAEFARADIHVITSLVEGNPTVLWEAMGHGVPTIAFDHCGMHDVICDRCGLRLGHRSIAEMIGELRQALTELIENRDRLHTLADGARCCARDALWTERAARWNAIYDLAIKRHAHHKR